MATKKEKVSTNLIDKVDKLKAKMTAMKEAQLKMTQSMV